MHEVWLIRSTAEPSRYEREDMIWWPSEREQGWGLRSALFEKLGGQLGESEGDLANEPSLSEYFAKAM